MREDCCPHRFWTRLPDIHAVRPQLRSEAGSLYFATLTRINTMVYSDHELRVLSWWRWLGARLRRIFSIAFANVSVEQKASQRTTQHHGVCESLAPKLAGPMASFWGLEDVHVPELADHQGFWLIRRRREDFVSLALYQ